MALGSGVRHLVSEALTWTLVIVAGFGAVYYFDDIRAAVGSTTAVVQQAYEAEDRNEDASQPPTEFERGVRLRANSHGHFAVAAHINGRSVGLMADTGATLVALTYEDARRVGFSDGELNFTGRTQTANGVARMARVTLDRVRVGDIVVRNVHAMVAEPGKLSINLLGMSFIGRLKSFEMRGNELVLNQ